MNPSTSPMKAPRNRSYVTCVICRLKGSLSVAIRDKTFNKPNLSVSTSHSKTYLLVLWSFDLICQPNGRRVIRTLKAIATVLQTAVDLHLHLYRSPGRCVRDSNPRGFYTQTVFKTAPSTYRTRNINLSFQIVRPLRSHFLIISKRQESSPAFQPESIRLSLYS